MQIQIQDNSGLTPSLLDRLTKRLQAILSALECSADTELSIVLCGDEEIAELNHRYLGRQGPTNVIAFPMQEGPGSGVAPDLLGDVVVSVDTARREAEENQLDPDEHLVRLLIHGVLHLLGHDHERGPAEARAMEDLTERLLEESAATGKEG